MKQMGVFRVSSLSSAALSAVVLAVALLSFNVSTAGANMQGADSHSSAVKRDRLEFATMPEPNRVGVLVQIRTVKKRCQSKRLVRIYYKPKRGKKRLVNSVRTKRNGMAKPFWAYLPKGNGILSGIAPRRNVCKRLRVRYNLISVSGKPKPPTGSVD